jgi:hypothetical protein
MTSLLDDLRPLRAPGDRRNRRRFLDWIPAALIVLVVVSFLTYRDRYQPLTQGELSGGPVGLVQLNDGLRDTGQLIRGGTTGTYDISLWNQGRFDIKVLAVGERELVYGGYMEVAGSLRSRTSRTLGFDEPDIPLGAFTLHPDEQVEIRLTIRATACPRGENSGGQRGNVQVRYKALGQLHTTYVPLPQPVFHSCPEPALPPRPSPVAP